MKKRKDWLLMLSGSNGGITGSILAMPCPLLAPGRTFRWTSASSCVPAFTRCRTPGCTTPGLAKGFVTPVVWFAVGFSFRPWDKPMNNCVFFEIQTFDPNVSFSFVGVQVPARRKLYRSSPHRFLRASWEQENWSFAEVVFCLFPFPAQNAQVVRGSNQVPVHPQS